MKKLTILLIGVVYSSFVVGSQEQAKKPYDRKPDVAFGLPRSVYSKYNEWDFRVWARPKTQAVKFLKPGESAPPGYVLDEEYNKINEKYGQRAAIKNLPISTKEEVYNKFISGYGPSDKETEEQFRYDRPVFIKGNWKRYNPETDESTDLPENPTALSNEDATKEFAWKRRPEIEKKYSRINKKFQYLTGERKDLENIEEQTPESYIKPKKSPALFSAYERPRTATNNTGFFSRLWNWLGWNSKPQYVAPQQSQNSFSQQRPTVVSVDSVEATE